MNSAILNFCYLIQIVNVNGLWNANDKKKKSKFLSFIIYVKAFWRPLVSSFSKERSWLLSFPFTPQNISKEFFFLRHWRKYVYIPVSNLSELRNLIGSDKFLDKSSV